VAVDLSKYRIRGAQSRALELLTPVKEDKSYMRLRRAFAKGADKWIANIENGAVREVRGKPEKFFNTPHRRWTALGRDGQLVTVPKVGTEPVDADLIFIGTADETIAFLGDLKTAANESQLDEQFKRIAGAEGGTPRRRRAAKEATPATPKKTGGRRRKAK
jgi:hypothetical protein